VTNETNGTHARRYVSSVPTTRTPKADTGRRTPRGRRTSYLGDSRFAPLHYGRIGRRAGRLWGTTSRGSRHPSSGVDDDASGAVGPKGENTNVRLANISDGLPSPWPWARNATASGWDAGGWAESEFDPGKSPSYVGDRSSNSARLHGLIHDAPHFLFARRFGAPLSGTIAPRRMGMPCSPVTWRGRQGRRPVGSSRTRGPRSTNEMTRQRTFTIAAFLFACGLPAVAADPPEVRSEYDVVYTKGRRLPSSNWTSPARRKGTDRSRRARYSRRRLARRQQR